MVNVSGILRTRKLILELKKKANKTFGEELITKEQYNEVFKKIRHYQQGLKMDIYPMSAVENDIYKLDGLVEENKKKEEKFDVIAHEMSMFKFYLKDHFDYDLKTINQIEVEELSKEEKAHRCTNCGKCEDLGINGKVFEVGSINDLPKFLQKIIEEQTK